jgi:hypothetical protein
LRSPVAVISSRRVWPYNSFIVLSQLRLGLIWRSAMPFMYADHATDPVSPFFQLSLYADCVRFSPVSSFGYHLPTSSTRFRPSCRELQALCPARTRRP